MGEDGGRGRRRGLNCPSGGLGHLIGRLVDRVDDDDIVFLTQGPEPGVVILFQLPDPTGQGRPLGRVADLGGQDKEHRDGRREGDGEDHGEDRSGDGSHPHCIGEANRTLDEQ